MTNGTWRWMSSVAVLLLAATPIAAQSTPDAAVSGALREHLAGVVKDKSVPGIVAAIADSNGVRVIAAAGVRKVGDDTAMTERDFIHIGSCTKAMTSTVAATLVAEGKLRWDSKLVDVVPELRGAIHADYDDTTLWDLVTHRAQFPANAKSWWAHADVELKARRLQLLKDTLRDKPTVPKGIFTYSNLGYLAAGCMVEAVTGLTWEASIQSRLFEPLGMTSAGFGPPGTTGETDQPWGHIRAGAAWTPSQADNAEALGPAGRVHCTLADWAKFAALQIPAHAPAILDRAQLDRLTVLNGDYAAGWGVVERPWAKGKALTHSGSNTMWFATIWIAPNIDRMFLVATNSADDRSPVVCDEVIGKLIELDRKQSSNE